MPRRHTAPEARRPLDRLKQNKGAPHPSHKGLKARNQWPSSVDTSVTDVVTITLIGGTTLVFRDSKCITAFRPGGDGGVITYDLVGAEYVERRSTWHNIRQRHLARAEGREGLCDLSNLRMAIGYRKWMSYNLAQYCDQRVSEYMVNMRGLSPAAKLVALEIAKSNDLDRMKHVAEVTRLMKRPSFFDSW